MIVHELILVIWFDSAILTIGDIMLPDQNWIEYQSHNRHKKFGKLDVLILRRTGRSEIFDQNDDQREKSPDNIKKHISDAESFRGLAVVIQKYLENVLEGRDNGLIETQKSEQSRGGWFDYDSEK